MANQIQNVSRKRTRYFYRKVFVSWDVAKRQWDCSRSSQWVQLGTQRFNAEGDVAKQYTDVPHSLNQVP